MLVEITLTPIRDENSSGIRISHSALAEAMLAEPEDLMAVNTMLVGVFTEALRALKQQRDFKQNRALVQEYLRDEDAGKKKRSDVECLGCRIDIADPRVARIDGNALIRCALCKEYRSGYYDASGALLSPATA